MRINHKILSLPPYVSTSWKNIASLHVEHRNSNTILIVTLSEGKSIEIPNLDGPILGAIFAAHAKFLENDQPISKIPPNETPPIFSAQEGAYKTPGMGFPFSLSLGGIENFGGALQHNPEQSDSPDIPAEILEKIATISKSVGLEDPNLIPKAEPHCNCAYCQISRAIHSSWQDKDETKIAQEELVSDEDLKFRSWDVSQETEKLYIVKNPLDRQESYHVFLGNPIGCTCGEKNCEHIQAVLYT